MLDWLTPAERRGGAVLIGLLVIGTAWGLWRPSRPTSRAGQLASTMDAGPSAPGDSSPAAMRTESVERKLDLNRASAAELDGLPGIGPVLAARIVEQRERAGTFRRLEDLMAVRGVGPRLLERLRPRVRLGSRGLEAALDGGVQSAPRPAGGRADSTSVSSGPSR